MRTLTIAIVTGLGLLASPLAFADQPVSPTPVSATSQRDALICHAIVHEGSVVHRSECRTQREWDRVRFESQQEIRNFQQRSLSSGM